LAGNAGLRGWLIFSLPIEQSRFKALLTRRIILLAARPDLFYLLLINENRQELIYFIRAVGAEKWLQLLYGQGLSNARK
jgi:hypothetical protein